MAFHLKLIQPKQLPAENVTSAEFKPWQNHLINFLQQDVENFRFLPGGMYAEWGAANEIEGNMRVAALAAEDEDLTAINGVVEAVPVKEARKTKLFKIRNAQLGKMLQHIVSFVNYTEADDIDQASTGMEWIFRYLRQHYNIEAKGPNFLKITEHVYKKGTLPQVFYKQFKTSFVNNLRKRGEVMTHKGGKVLTSDEVLSPSFEDAIVLWALEKIDPRLPKKVRKDYEHRLTADTFLIDLQVTIFQSIPTILEELDRQAEVNALTTTGGSQEASLCAARFGNKGNFQRGDWGAGRGSRRGSGRGSGRGYEMKSGPRTFCRVCHAAGKPTHVYKSHNVGTCSFFDGRDRKDLYTSLRAMNLDEQDDEDSDTWTVDTDDLEETKEDPE